MSEYTFDVSHMDLFYNDFQALKDINMKIKKNEITALIGRLAAANRHSSRP